MKTADMLTYVQEIGALGGTLTLEYDSGEITLAGDDLIRAAADYDMSDPFTIVSEPEETPWELAEADNTPNFVPDNAAKLVFVGIMVVGFLAIGVILL